MLISTIQATVPSIEGNLSAGSERAGPVNPGVGQGGGSSCEAWVDTGTLTWLVECVSRRQDQASLTQRVWVLLIWRPWKPTELLEKEVQF